MLGLLVTRQGGKYTLQRLGPKVFINLIRDTRHTGHCDGLSFHGQLEVTPKQMQESLRTSDSTTRTSGVVCKEEDPGARGSILYVCTLQANNTFYGE